MLDIKMKMLLEKDTIYLPLTYVGHKNGKNMRQCHLSSSMLDIKIWILLKKGTIQFLLIYDGHENENVVKKCTKLFCWSMLDINMKMLWKKTQYNFRWSMLDIKIKISFKKRDNTSFVDLC